MKKLYLLMFLFISGNAIAQKIPSSGFDKIRIVDGEKIIQAELKEVKSDPGIESDRYYYWAGANIIHSTQGGFSGRLLNGSYSEYYSSKNLKEQGFFKKGLKDGVWKTWSEKGILTEWFTWNSGIKSGKYSLFDDHGNLKQSGKYHNNLLNGKVESYDNGKITMLRYHKGVVVDQKSPSFWRRLNILKKKKKEEKKINEVKK